MQILDCTLRDGGYYTNWDFEPELVEQYAKTLAALPISCVEIGYRTPASSGYGGEYQFLPLATIKRLAAHLAPQQALAVMLNAKECQPSEVGALLEDCRGSVEMVRLAVDPAQIDHGLALAAAIKAMGFRVGLNLMYLSKLTEEHPVFRRLERLGDEIDVISLVDSYGACFPEQVTARFQHLRKLIPHPLGFHGHDNIGLAFANSLAALNAGATWVDATITGMGRGAGNLRTELMVAYLTRGRNSDLSALGELLETFKVMKSEYGWGSELPYIISGLEGLPQKDVMDWLSKKRYATSTIIRALQGSGHDMFDEKRFPDIATWNAAPQANVLVIGGGASAIRHQRALKELALRQRTLVVHSSLKHALAYRDVPVPQIACLSGHEARKLSPEVLAELASSVGAYVVSTPPRVRSEIPEAIASRTYEAKPIFDAYEDPIFGKDAPLSLALGVAKALSAKDVMLTGFDGYPNDDQAQRQLASEVQRTLDSFEALYPEIALSSLTPTDYALRTQSVYALIATPQGAQV